MRVVSRLIIAVAGLLLLTLLAGVIGWLTRHLWVPTVINHQLDGITLTGLHGLTLGRQNNQLNVYAERLKLLSDTGVAVDVEDVQLIGLRALLRTVMSSNATKPARARLQVAKVVIHSPPATLPAPPADAAAHPTPEAGPLEPEPDQSLEADTGNAYFSIGDTLRTLQKFPLSGVEIEQLYWPGRFDRFLSVSVQNAPGQKLTGAVHSARCESCEIKIALNTQERQPPDLQVQLTHSGNRVVDFRGSLNPMSGTGQATGSRQWMFESQLRVDAQRIAPLFRQLDASLFPAATAPHAADWNALASSLSGQIALTLGLEIPDAVTGMADVRNITTTLAAPMLSAALPEMVAGVPLAINYVAREPLNVRITTLSPLRVESVQGTFSLALIPLAPDLEAKGSSAAPLLETRVSLTTNKTTPQIEFAGSLDLARMTPLLESPRWSQALQKYAVKRLSGEQQFSGSALLPSLQSIVNGQSSATLAAFNLELASVTPAKFHLALPRQGNPLEELGWKAANVQATLPQTLLISAKQVPGPMTLKIPELTFKATEASRRNGQKKQAAPELEGRINQVLCGKLPVIDCALTLQTSLNKLDLPNAATALSQLKLDATSTVRRDDGSGSMELVFTNLNLAAGQVTSGPAKVSAPELFAQSASCKVTPRQTACQIPELALSIAPLAVEKNQVSGVVFLRDSTIHNTPGKAHGLNIQSQYHGDNLNVRALDHFRATVATKGHLTLADGQLSGNSTLSSGPLNMESQWSHSLETGKGELNITLPTTTFSPDNALTRAVQGLPADIVDGSVHAGVQLYWPDKGRDQAFVVMRDTGLQVNKSFAVGVNAEVKLEQSGEQWVTQNPARVSIDTLDAGVAMNDLHFSLQLEPGGDLVLRGFAAELLDGALTAETLAWNLNGQERHSQLQFTGISLKALAREMESENFAASGLLDARIPLVTDKQGVTVENGTVQSRPPGGRLRYYGAFSPAMLGSNPQLKLLAGALEDYNYRDINGTINYPLSGDLKLNLKLTGRSDAIAANRDLIINLNLENNIPTMLRSLQASRDLTDVLEKQVQ